MYSELRMQSLVISSMFPGVHKDSDDEFMSSVEPVSLEDLEKKMEWEDTGLSLKFDPKKLNFEFNSEKDGYNNQPAIFIY